MRPGSGFIAYFFGWLESPTLMVDSAVLGGWATYKVQLVS